MRIQVCVVAIIFSLPMFAIAAQPTTILEDHFERSEQDDTKEQVGGEWKTNSKSRAAGNKQVDLNDGTVHITRHAVADHGVSLNHPAEFTNGQIALRFKLRSGDDLGIDIADAMEKSVHAGHLMVVRIRPDRVELVDLKNGVMENGIRERRKSNTSTDADKAAIAATKETVKRKTIVDQWHDLVINIEGDHLSASIDGETVGTLTSPGVAHPTKRLIRIAVEKQAWIDDVIITRID